MKRAIAGLLPVSLLGFLLPGCAIQFEPGWDVRLTNKLVDRRPLFPHSDNILKGRARRHAGAALQVGDEALYGLYLDLPGQPRVYYVHISVAAIEQRHWHPYRASQPFEKRLKREGTGTTTKPAAQPGFGPELMPEPAPELKLELRLEPQPAEPQPAEPQPTFVEEPEPEPIVPVARVRVRMLDATGSELRGAATLVSVDQLQIGMKRACMAGPQLHGLLSSQPDPTAPEIHYEDLTRAQQRSVDAVQEGLAACNAFLAIVKANKKMQQILREVVALPTVWSMLRERGIHSNVMIDFFAASKLPGTAFPGVAQELWSFPFALKLNDQPSFLARAAVGETGSPDGVVAGVHAIVLRHAADDDRRVFIQLLATRRGTGRPASPADAETP